MCGNVYLVFMCSCCGATSAFFHCLTLFVLSYFHLCISLAPPFISAPLSFAHRKPASERDSCRAVRARGKTASNLDCYQFSKKAPTLRKNSSCRCELWKIIEPNSGPARHVKKRKETAFKGKGAVGLDADGDINGTGASSVA